MNLNKYKLLAGDASFRKFYRSKKIDNCLFPKNKYSNLLVYAAINRCLNNNGVQSSKIKKRVIDKNYIEIQDLGNETILRY